MEIDDDAIRQSFDKDEWQEILAAIPAPPNRTQTPSTEAYFNQMELITTLPALMGLIGKLPGEVLEDEIAEWMHGLCVTLSVPFSIAVLNKA